MTESEDPGPLIAAIAAWHASTAAACDLATWLGARAALYALLPDGGDAHANRGVLYDGRVYARDPSRHEERGLGGRVVCLEVVRTVAAPRPDVPAGSA